MFKILHLLLFTDRLYYTTERGFLRQATATDRRQRRRAAILCQAGTFAAVRNERFDVLRSSVKT